MIWYIAFLGGIIWFETKKKKNNSVNWFEMWRPRWSWFNLDAVLPKTPYLLLLQDQQHRAEHHDDNEDEDGDLMNVRFDEIDGIARHFWWNRCNLLESSDTSDEKDAT